MHAWPDPAGATCRTCGQGLLPHPAPACARGAHTLALVGLDLHHPGHPGMVARLACTTEGCSYRARLPWKRFAALRQALPGLDLDPFNLLDATRPKAAVPFHLLES